MNISEAIERSVRPIKKYFSARTPSSFKEVLTEEIQRVRARRGRPTDETIEDPIDAAHKENLFGIALSGGGIRSATFNLGLLESLARKGLISRSDYLSTVSGGGYIGSWLTAWIKRDGQKHVEDTLKQVHTPQQISESARRKISSDSYPVTHLRRFTNYLTPKTGLLSLDTFVLATTYLRNLVLNLLVIALASSAFILLVRSLVKIAAILENRAVSIRYLIAIFFLFSLAAVVTAVQLNRPSLVPDHSDDEKSKGDEQTFSSVDEELAKADQSNRSGRKAHFWVVVPVFIGSIMFAQIDLSYVKDLNLALWMKVSYPILWIGITTTVFWRHIKEPKTNFKFLSRVATVALILLVALPVAALSFVVSDLILDVFPKYKSLIPAFGGPLVLCGVYAVVILFIGLAGRALTEEQRQWLSRIGASLIVTSIAWTLVLSIVQFGPWILEQKGLEYVDPYWLLLLVWPTMSAAGAYSGHKIEVDRMRAGIAKRFFLQAAPYIFILGLALFNSHAIASFFHSSWFTTVFDHPYAPFFLDSQTPLICSGESSDPRCFKLLEDPVTYTADLSLFFVIAVLAYLMSWRVDINLFSMHNSYKSRLIRAFLGASNVPRTPDPFTGFAQSDDMPMTDLQYKRRSNDTEDDGYDGPIPIMNCALNLVGTRELSFQERKASSFAFTPYYFGFEYERSEPVQVFHGNKLRRTIKDSAYRSTDSYQATPSLGFCMAVSGAAVSPNMGYRSSPGLAFLLTVFNARLGSWIANPLARAHTDRLTPRLGFRNMLYELFAKTSERTDFVYISDGGHFENLGLYELVRRRCRYIVVSDASADSTIGLADLSNAIRKIRADFGIRIELDVSDLAIGKNGYSCSHYTVGTIHYDRAERNEQPGFLLFIKSSVTGDEPVDLMGFKKEHPSFPHQSTADQWFTESQFGSYRVLGRHIGSEVFHIGGREKIEDLTLEEIFSRIRWRAHPASAKIENSFTSHASKLQSLLADLSKEEDLNFLDQQLFPDSYRFRDVLAVGDSGIPDDPKVFRKGFYFCNRLVQLMENVFIDLALDREYSHPDNRGWFNLFNHWTSSNMLRLTWALSASTYGSRFQRFCDEHFDMDFLKMKVVHEDIDDMSLEAFAKSRFKKGTITSREKTQFGKIIKHCDFALPDIRRFWQFVLCIRIDSDTSGATKNYRLPCGFALTDGHGRILFFRIRDHLRGLGLARQILMKMGKKIGQPVDISPHAREIYEAISRYPRRGRYFEILLHSIRAAQIDSQIELSEQEEGPGE